MLFARLREVLGIQPMGQVELLLSLEQISLAVWMLLSGGDCTFRIFRGEIQGLLPIFRSGKAAMVGLIVISLIRIWAVLVDRLMFRVWVARLTAFGWMTVLLAYAWAGVGANELPLYLVGFVANFWLSVRLDVRGARERASARRARARHQL